MAYIGIDLHSDNFTICCLEPGVGKDFTTYSLSFSGLEEFVSTLFPDDEIAVESVDSAAWFCDRVSEFGGCIVVVNSSQFEVTRRVGWKIDRNDAEMLTLQLWFNRVPYRSSIGQCL